MGLDGISINQLRVTQEHNSLELNNISKITPEVNPKVVDGLSQGQKVDPDKEKEHERESSESKSEKNESQDDISKDIEEVIKYDLSKSDKYSLKVDDDTNDILIIDKTTKEPVQRIGADELVNFVGFLSNSQGSIVNRKF